MTTTTSPLSVLMLREGGNLSPRVQLEGGDSLLGLWGEEFLATQLSTNRHHLANLLDNTQAVNMFNTTVSAAVDLMTPFYLAAMYQSLNISPLLVQRSKVSWNLTDVVSQHSPYCTINQSRKKLMGQRATMSRSAGVEGGTGLRSELHIFRSAGQ